MEYQEYTKIIDYFASINPQDLLRVDNSSIEEIVHILTGFILLYKNDPEYTNQLKQAAHERGLSLAFGERIVKELLEKVL